LLSDEWSSAAFMQQLAAAAELQAGISRLTLGITQPTSATLT